MQKIMNDSHVELIERTVEFVKSTLQGAEGGHDWFHIQRVWKISKKLAKEEEEDSLVVELGALLHDIADSKFHAGDENKGPTMARNFLSQLEVPEDDIEHVVQIIRNISFKGGNFKKDFSSKALDIVQDADRIDALGAIGIARTFNYGGYKNRAIYDPNVKSNLTMTKEQYKSSNAPTINHFYEKLLLLKDQMNTVSGKKMAEGRHQFLETYLEHFYKEWEGKI